MKQSYVILFNLQDKNQSSSPVPQEMYVTLNMPDLGVFLNVLSNDSSITNISVYKTTAIPDMIKLQKVRAP